MAKQVLYSADGRLVTSDGEDIDLSALISVAATITQTYATADAAIAALTSADPAALTAVAPAATAATNVTPYGFSQAQADAIKNACINLITDLGATRTQLIALRADVLAVKKNLNTVIDALQLAEVAG